MQNWLTEQTVDVIIIFLYWSFSGCLQEGLVIISFRTIIDVTRSSNHCLDQNCLCARHYLFFIFNIAAFPRDLDGRSPVSSTSHINDISPSLAIFLHYLIPVSIDRTRSRVLCRSLCLPACSLSNILFTVFTDIERIKTIHTTLLLT